MSAPDLEVVIEDNSDTDELRTWIRQNVLDTRITYHYSDVPTSQSGNYDRSMRGVTAEYVAFIGDDDGVNPEIVEATAWAKENDLDALTPASMVNYSWPDLHMTRPTAVQAGELAIRPFTCHASYPDGTEEMLKCARDVGQSFHRMPKAYYGVVRRTCLDRVKHITGSYFPGISPDMASAVSLAGQVRRMCYLDYPLFVPGSSRRSLAGIGGLGQHVGSLRDQTHLPADCERNWSPIVPRFFSVQTIWGEAAIEAISSNGQKQVLRQCDIPKYYANCLTTHLGYHRTILRQFPHALRAVDQNTAVGTALLIGRLVGKVLGRAKRLTYRLFAKNPPAQTFRVRNLPDIEAAVVAFSGFLNANTLSFRAAVAEANNNLRPTHKTNGESCAS
jgi:hypothetical protein